jgi:hypothetical protein
MATQSSDIDVRAPGQRTAWVRRWQRHDALSALVWLAAWVATLILLLGIGLIWGGPAVPQGATVHAVLRAGTWLATPFHDVFTNADARVRLTENWALAAVVYLIAGRVLAWLLRW